MLTLPEACHYARIPLPVSEDDLRRTALELNRRGIKTNMDSEPLFQGFYRDERKRVHNEAQRAIKLSQSLR